MATWHILWQFGMSYQKHLATLPPIMKLTERGRTPAKLFREKAVFGDCKIRGNCIRSGNREQRLKPRLVSTGKRGK
jgi:hypothetical protein